MRWLHKKRGRSASLPYAKSSSASLSRLHQLVPVVLWATHRCRFHDGTVAVLLHIIMSCDAVAKKGRPDSGQIPCFKLAAGPPFRSAAAADHPHGARFLIEISEPAISAVGSLVSYSSRFGDYFGNSGTTSEIFLLISSTSSSRPALSMSRTMA